jgi:hypothetical protein
MRIYEIIILGIVIACVIVAGCISISIIDGENTKAGIVVENEMVQPEEEDEDAETEEE